METPDDFWGVIEASHSMPGLVSLKDDSISSMSKARRADSYNSAASGLLVEHAIDSLDARKVVVVDTMKNPNSEKDLDWAAWHAGIDLSGEYSRQRARREFIDAQIREKKVWGNARLDFPNMNRPFPVEGLMSLDQGNANFKHGVRVARQWLGQDS
jgi:hypothetical protein